MKLDIKFKKRPGLEIIADCSFALFLISEVIFKHTLFAQLSLAMFIGSIGLLCLSKQRIYNSYFFLFFGLFIIYNWLNIQYGNVINPDASLALLNTLVLNFVFMFCLYNYIILRNETTFLLKLYISVSILVTAAIIFLSLPELFTERLGSSIGVNSNVLAIFTGIAFLMTYYFMLYNKRLIYWIILIWFLIVILLTGSRKGIFMIFIGAVLMNYLSFPKKRVRYLLYTILGLTVVYILIINIPIFHDLIGTRLQAILNFIQGEKTNDLSLLTRNKLIDSGWNAFLNKPWFGHGLDSFRYISVEVGDYAHNNFIEILVNSGLIGFMLYYINHIIALIRSLSEIRKGSSLLSLAFTLTFVFLLMDYAIVSYFERLYLIPLILTIALTKLNEKNRLNFKINS